MKDKDETVGQDTMTGTLGKAVSLLELVVMADEPLRFRDILLRTGQPKGTLHRQLTHLVKEGLLEQNFDQTYVAGTRLLKFAARAWSRNDLRKVAAPHLHSLHAATGESIHLGVLRSTEIIYLDKVDGQQSVRMHSQIGKASPVYCTGVGKAALSMLDEAALMQLIEKLEFEEFTANTITVAQALRDEIRSIRDRGYAYDLEEHEAGIHCVAAPVLAPGQSFLAALSVTGPAYRVSPDRLQEWAPLVCEAARNISNDLAMMLSPAG